MSENIDDFGVDMSDDAADDLREKVSRDWLVRRF